MRRRDFERLVERALQELPEPFLQQLGDVVIIIEDWPSRDLLLQLGMDPDQETLFGYFEGDPLTALDRDYSGRLPSRIYVFKGPIEEVCDTYDEIAEEVRLTVLHEIGHFFGLSEEQVEHL